MKWLVLVLLAACTKPNPGVCCENEVECTRLGIAADDTRPCVEGVCVVNACVADGCDGEEDCGDPNQPFCVAGTCSAGCDGNEDCLDADFPICVEHVCSVDCEARGGRIAFESSRSDGDIHVMYADGFGLETFLDGPPFDERPVWSRDGRQLAWIRAGDVFVASFSTPVADNVSNSPATDDRIEWSPDGARIAYEAVDGSNRFARLPSSMEPMS